MLTANDPRHSRNGGGMGAAAQPVTVINAVDGSDALDHALSNPRGGEIMLNFLRANRDKVKGVLG
jgi:hypothetical protein